MSRLVRPPQDEVTDWLHSQPGQAGDVQGASVAECWSKTHAAFRRKTGSALGINQFIRLVTQTGRTPEPEGDGYVLRLPPERKWKRRIVDAVS